MARFSNSYTERRQQLMQMLGRRTRFVFMSKIALGMMIAALLSIIIILPLMEQDTRITLTSTAPGEELQPVMVNPKFQGVDAQNQPFMVTASRAFHKDSDTVEMENIQADLTMKDRTWLALSAKKGALNLKDQTLTLMGQVKLYHDKGYEFATESLRIDTATGNAAGESTLTGQGQIGNFTAEQFSIFDKGERMVLSGHVTMTIKPDA